MEREADGAFAVCVFNTSSANVRRSSPAQSSRGMRSFFASAFAAASGGALASFSFGSASVRGNVVRGNAKGALNVGSTNTLHDNNLTICAGVRIPAKVSLPLEKEGHRLHCNHRAAQLARDDGGRAHALRGLHLAEVQIASVQGTWGERHRKAMNTSCSLMRGSKPQ
ncbi:hypothetical protein [Archangium lipolyticum]|uniref:hypothetical protein n=1 Tax=Archangium lipolyticum TaxID=2970465 RepID=UPI00214D10D3|nr:hypothetical protein [Archangium lipolyticum]